VFYPDEVSTASLFTNLCSVIAEEDYDVEVWCAQPSYSVFKRQPSSVNYKGIKIKYLPSTNFNKNRIPGRIANIITFFISVSFKLLLSKDKNPVFTHTTPQNLGILLSFICAIRKRKFVYIMLDIFPEGLIRLGKVSRENLLIRFWNYLFITSLKNCEIIIVIGRDMEKWLKEICPHCHYKLRYIPHWQDDSLIFPGKYTDNELVKAYRLENKFVVQYSGNMGLWNDMTTLGRAVGRNLEDVVFMFVGGGTRKAELLSAISAEDQKNVLFIPFQPTEKLGVLLTACHAGLVSMKEGLQGMAVPCKIYGILAAGVPVIAMVPEDSEIAFVVNEEKCGFVINPGDLEGLINAILHLKNDDDLRASMSRNGRRAFEEKYSVRIIAEQYKVLISGLE